MVRSQRGGRFTVALAGTGVLLGASLLGAVPAHAASGCSYLDYDQSSGYVSGSCYGDHSGAQARVQVNCNAVWPLTPWSDVRYVTVGYGSSFGYYIANCPWPASYGISATVS